MEDADDYVYLPLKDAMSCIGQKVNLFGVVVEHGVPRKTKGTGLWWESYGDHCPELQKLAIRILSLTCSATGCERNWSTFEQIHSKKRNRLEQKRLNALVFVKYNLQLRVRHARRESTNGLDPICLSDMESDDEWITEKEDPSLPEDNTWMDMGEVFSEPIDIGDGAGSSRSKDKRKDYVCTLKIVDSSCQDGGFSVNIFFDRMDKMPDVKSDGDIICLHHVVMKIYDGVVYALFNKKFSIFALFGGTPSEGFKPYQVSSKVQITNHDKEYIIQLRTWFVDHQLDTGVNTYLVQLKEVKVGGFSDLICKILHVSEDLEGKWVIFVWDGTDVPPVSFQMNVDAEGQSPLPLQLEPSPLSRDVLCTFPSLGTVLRIFAINSCEKFGLQSIGIGRWVKFRKIKFESQSGLCHGVMTSSSRLCALSDNDRLVVNYQRYYDERVSSNVGHLPLSCFPCPSLITETDYDHVGFSTLMDVLTYSKIMVWPGRSRKQIPRASSERLDSQRQKKLNFYIFVTQKFKCVVRVVASFPWRAEDIRSPEGTRVYRIRLTLEDPTARIHAYVYAEDGVKFFEGYPPTDVLTRKMNKLLGVTEGGSSDDSDNVSRNPPWVQCCIKSYYLEKSNPWETRRYRIFATKIVE